MENTVSFEIDGYGFPVAYDRRELLLLFPPSFYYTHTQKETERITRYEIAEQRRMLQDYQERNMVKGEGWGLFFVLLYKE